MAWEIDEGKAKKLGIEAEYRELQNQKSLDQVAQEQEEGEERTPDLPVTDSNKIILLGRPITKKKGGDI